ncbi:acyltransferase [Aerococcaceae bacterium DSM 111020]|nr:acyltransferase [Aerococcaceae bacterium DSM 111020]
MSQIKHNNRIAAFDGIKGFAILAILGYYFYEHFLPGGYLAVNIFLFFAGFMNVRYFYQREELHQPYSVLKYYKKRLSRLFFPMLWLIIFVSAFVLVFASDFLVNLRGTSIASLFFVNNYFQLANDYSYFVEAVAPNPFSHLWYVSLLAQFIILTPLLVKIVYSFHRQAPTASVMLGILSLVSFITMAYLYSGSQDPSNVYFRISTRAFAYTLGGAIGFILPLNLKHTITEGKQRRIINGVGAILFVLIILMMIFMYGTQDFAYYFGMFLFTLIVAVFYVILTFNDSIWHTLFSFKPLTWLGRRSYSYYLWFYPIYLIVPKLAIFTNLNYSLMLWVQFILLILFAELSYRLFEQEVIDLPIGQDFNWKKMHYQLSVLAKSGKALMTIKVLTGIYLVFSLLAIIAQVQSGSGSEDIAELESLIQTNQEQVVEEQSEPTETRAINNIEGLSQEELLYANGLDVTFFGDSTLLSAANQVKAVFPKAVIDGAVGRQLYNSYADIASLEEQGLLKDTVIFLLGSNGTFGQTQIDDIISVVGDQRDIYFVTSNAQRAWTMDANNQLRQASDRYGNVDIIDWASFASNHPEWLRESDQAHPTTVGAQELAKFIAKEVYRLR